MDPFLGTLGHWHNSMLIAFARPFKLGAAIRLHSRKLRISIGSYDMDWYPPRWAPPNGSMP